MVGRALSAGLADVQFLDPGTLSAAAVLLLGTAAVAAWLPARRASRFDPAATLRAE